MKNRKCGSCYIIAEIGGNFTQFEEAKLLIDAAKGAGVDAIKLQTYRADTLSSKSAMFEMENTGNVSQFELFKKFELSDEIHVKVFEYANSCGLDWFSTPAHQTDVDLLERLGVSVYKIGSDDAVNIPLLQYVARLGKPILLSTGMCVLDEVKASVDAILAEGNDDITLLHAITSYPTHPQHVNLKAMQTLQREFPLLSVGYSDHTLGPLACVASVAMGAKVIERHFTLDKNAEGPDHMLSSDPEEMKYIVDQVRTLELMLGNGIKRPSDAELGTRINNRKSIVATARIQKGEEITLANIDIKRPGTGIEPKFFFQILGSTAVRDIADDEVITWKDISH